MYKKSILAMIVLVFISGTTADDLLASSLENLKTNERQMVRMGIPEEDAANLTRLMVENHFTEQHAVRIQHLVIKTIEADLPHDPVMNKAFEGIAKNIAPENIAKAMEKTRTRYAYAYNLADQVARNKNKAREIGNILVQGLTAGMQIEDSNRVMANVQQATRQMTRSQSQEMALQAALTTRTMARLGVSSQTAANVACRALDEGYSTQEMAQLRHTFSEQAANRSSQKLASHFSQVIHAGARPGGLAKGGASAKGGFGSHGGSHGGSTGVGGPGGGGSGPGGSGGGSGGSGGGSGGSGGGSGGSGGGSGGSGGGSGGD